MASQSRLKRAVYSSTSILTACTNTNAHHHHHHQHQNAASPNPSQKQKQNNLAAKLRQHARADATANSRRRPTYANCSKNFKLISTLQATALTLLTLTLSSWIAYGTAAAVATATATAAQFEDASNNGDMSGLPFDYAALVLEPAANAYTAMPMAALPSPTPSSSSPTSLPYNSNSTNAFLAAILGGSTAKPNSSISIFASSSTVIPTLGGTSTSSTAIINSSTSGSGSGSDSNQTSIGSLNASMAPQLTAEELDEEDFVMPPMHAIFVSLILLVVILGTVVGNVLVCIAVCMVRKLRRPCNYLLVSLALSDLCVAVLVMPMALLYEVLEAWNFGPVLCDIWVSFDVLCCTASILNLCAISVDRYLAITKPLEYGVKRTPRRMMLCVAVVWLAAACISLPPLLILGNEHVGENGEPICTVCQNSAYQIYATLGSFYIPLSVMLFVYYQIFRAARRIVLEEKRAQTHLQHALNGTGSPQPLAGHTELDPGGGNGNGNGQRHSSVGNTSLTYSTCGGLSGHGHHGSGGGVSGSTGLLGSPHHKKLRFQLAKEKKASTTLGIIMSAFTICWLPFFILALIRPFVESETTHVPASLSSLFLWLGYANSLLNPIIYATLNRDFRKPFQEILYFRCSSLNTMMRENYYQDQYGEPPSQRVMLGDERHGARESFL